MAAATDELILLERVFLRLGSADTDEQLQASVCKFLPPILLKLSSSQEGVRKKVMELLIHINRRVKSRPLVQLPVEALLLQYQDPAASSFVINFSIIYIKLGYPRMEISKQAELVPSVLNAIEGKPLSHQDSLLLIIMPALGHIRIPTDPEKRAPLLGLQDKPYVAKQLLNFMLDMLILPYRSVIQTSQETGQPIEWFRFPVPPGLNQYAFKRVIGETPHTSEQLEQIKIGIVKFISGGFFPDSDILIHLIVAAADTTYSVANIADIELKKIVNTLDWSSVQLAGPLYTLFLGTDALATQKEVKPEMKRLPACTRIRLKLLHYLCRVTRAGFIIPLCIQVVFDSLYGRNTNKYLKFLALQFTLNIIQQCSLVQLVRVGGVILNGMIKLISDGDDVHKPKAYTIIGQLGQRVPTLINKDLSLLQNFFDALASTVGDLRTSIRDALISMTSSFVLLRDDETNLAVMNSLLSVHIESPESSVRYVAVHYAATVFPPDDAPSRYLLLLACGDSKHEVNLEAMKALYGSAYKHEEDKDNTKHIFLPDFSKLVCYIHTKLQARMAGTHPGRVNIGSKTIPYNITTFTEIITYLRLCLAKSANVPVQTEPLEHPCEHTPTIGRYLENISKEHPESLNYYQEMIMMLSHVTADRVPLNALLEVVGTIPLYALNRYESEIPWLRSMLSSSKESIRELAAKIYAIIIAYIPDNDFEKQVSEIINSAKSKVPETQHGALVALSHMMERKLRLWKHTNKDELLKWNTYLEAVKTLYAFLTDSSMLLVSAATEGIGNIGKAFALPIPSEDDKELNKKAVVDTLFLILTNVKTSGKVKEKAALALGCLCVGEEFPHATFIAEKFISLAAETKDVEIHLTVGESLVCCVQGEASPKGRDAWTMLPTEYSVPYSEGSNELLKLVLDKLLKLSNVPHPHSRQAVCIWLLALVKHNAKRKEIVDKTCEIQNAFTGFLSENNDFVQDVASKGLGLVYYASEEAVRKDLLENLTNQLLQGRRAVTKVNSDTKLFEEGELGKSVSGGSLSTYREICSLATELNQPELVYRFLHLANHNAVWTSKKGAAFGFSVIANLAKEDLNKLLPIIAPKLYRYQYDPTPRIQRSMTSIWHAIIPSTHNILEQYHKEILADLSSNITSYEWRVRISCCLALADLLRSNVPINLVESGPELWKQLFRVMDDFHEGTRLAANKTVIVFSELCIRRCDPSQGKAGEQILQAILPVLLDVGIVHVVATVRAISLQTVSQFVKTAGDLLKPSLVNLIPALLTATGELENPLDSYWSTRLGGNSEEQEVHDRNRALAAKNYYTTETVTKCVQYIDASVLKDLMPKVLEIVKSNVVLGTKVACSQFLILLCSHLKQDLQPYTGKILAALVNGLTDRNSVLRKSNAVTIGHIVGSAKESSLEKLFNMLNTWYMEREDDTIRLAIGQTLQSINTHNQEILRNYSDIVMPLTFFAMHAEKVPGNEATIELWTDLWGDISPGTEMGIRQHLTAITTILNSSLESASWTTKAQAANAVSTVATKLGSSIDEEARSTLLKILTNGLRGRTWNGKERLLNGLATLACNSKEAVSKDTELLETIVESLHKESKKEAIEYRRYALKAFSDVLHELQIDRFSQVHDIAQEVLLKVTIKEDDDEEKSLTERTKKKEDILKLQETLYEALGKAWPSNKETQDKYCLQFVTHCYEVLPKSTRTLQVAILTMLNLFVDKLVLLQIDATQTSPKDKETLKSICDVLEKILRHSMGISKYTRIRKEALNIVFSLSRRFRDTKNITHLENLTTLFTEVLPDLSGDNQPEIRSRVIDIKDMLKI
ncbi:proteasome-associated protein ECM29 homolog isoform X2 [Orussus abietinus]|uniref:proteasome-associated protein ECM29 homolog isoform X2 n=1 Tax=Orussus abietinus TaxID=222816 RepID=UPI000625B512|nr:proteasome-associated protein ECM29 homolog isoform X2 [Orussus abietinus]XP_012280900.1 proteasome-associated protein ECM29 homolog isoform X2 [Orussus abietinus]